jgi:hypothetical protein
MSIVVACQCGKRFKAGDQYAGKRTRCPGCGQALTIPAAASVAVAPLRPKPPAVPTPVPVDSSDDLLSLADQAETEVFQPAARTEASRPSVKSSKTAAAGVPPTSKRDRTAGSSVVPSITVSPFVIIMIALTILIPSAIYWAKEGPMKANADWAKIKDIAESNIDGQITRAMNYQIQHMGFDMTDLKYRPHATSVVFDEPILMFRVPESIDIQGMTTEGMFHGVFHPRTWRFEVTAPILKSDHQVNGCASETDQSLEVDGAAVKD